MPRPTFEVIKHLPHDFTRPLCGLRSPSISLQQPSISPALCTSKLHPMFMSNFPGLIKNSDTIALNTGVRKVTSPAAYRTSCLCLSDWVRHINAGGGEVGSGRLLLGVKPGGLVRFSPIKDMLDLNMQDRHWIKARMLQMERKTEFRVKREQETGLGQQFDSSCFRSADSGPTQCRDKNFSCKRKKTGHDRSSDAGIERAAEEPRKWPQCP